MNHTGQELAEIVARISYRDLPRKVSCKTKQVILDSIGCALGARVTDRARITLELVDELGGNPQATIIGGGRSSWTMAAYANAELIHALDFEPCGPRFGHIVPYVLSPCFSVAERVKASGNELIAAVALALEVGSRIFTSVPGYVSKEEPPYYALKTIFSFGSTQVYGGVAGASSLLALDSGRIANAFGIAGTNMPVPAGRNWHLIPRPAIMTKFNDLTGWIAQLSTMACLLAERGFTGDITFLDSKIGFKNILGAAEDFDPEVIIGDLGKSWWTGEMGENDHQWIKSYPCCGVHHAGINLIIQIIQQNNIDPSNIEEIVVKGASKGPPWDEPFSEVVSFADCSHSNAYAYAVAAYYGQNPGPNWVMPGTYNDPRIRKLMKLVRTEDYPKVDESPITADKARPRPGFSDTIVELTSNGKRYTAETKSAQFITSESTNEVREKSVDDLIRAKFRNNASFSSLRRETVEEIIDAIYSLEEIQDVSEVLRMFG